MQQENPPWLVVGAHGSALTQDRKSQRQQDAERFERAFWQTG